MKYIRTKDGRILESEINDNRKSLGYEPIEFITQADTIEELCDRCVVKLKYEKQPFVGSFYEFEHFINQHTKKIASNNPVVDIFGAIWTDKGLIYVAKMNDKGELELI